MYVVNTPWALKAMYSMVKPWIHPVTQAKINIVGKPKEAVKLMTENDGFELSALPEFMGGTNPGTDSYSVLQDAIAATQAASSAAPAPTPLAHAPLASPEAASGSGGGGSGGGSGGAAAAAAAGGVNPFYPSPLGTML